MKKIIGIIIGLSAAHAYGSFSGDPHQPVYEQPVSDNPFSDVNLGDPLYAEPRWFTDPVYEELPKDLWAERCPRVTVAPPLPPARFVSSDEMVPLLQKPALVVALAAKDLACARECMEAVKRGAEGFFQEVKSCSTALTNPSNVYLFAARQGSYVQHAHEAQRILQGPLAVMILNKLFRSQRGLSGYMAAFGRVQVAQIVSYLDPSVRRYVDSVSPDQVLANLKPQQLRAVFVALKESPTITYNNGDPLIQPINTDPGVQKALRLVYQLLAYDKQCQKAALLVLQGKQIALHSETEKVVCQYKRPM